MAEMKKVNEDIANKLDDPENWGCRKNLVVFGIPEREEGRDDCLKTVCDFLKFCRRCRC